MCVCVCMYVCMYVLCTMYVFSAHMYVCMNAFMYVRIISHKVQPFRIHIHAHIVHITYTHAYTQYRKSVGVDKKLEEEHEAEIQQALVIHDQYMRNIAVGRAVAALENITQWTSYKTTLGGQVV